MTRALLSVFLILFTTFFASEIGEASTSQARIQFRGVSTYGLLNKNFNKINKRTGRSSCDNLLYALETADAPGISIAWGGFADPKKRDFSCLIRFLDKFQDRPHLVQTHIEFGPCRRNAKHCRGRGVPFDSGRTDSGDLNKILSEKRPQHVSVIQNYAADILDVMEAYKNPNTHLWLSLGVEDNFSDKAYAGMLSMLKPVWPYTFTRNPVGNNKSQGHKGSRYKEYHTAGAIPSSTNSCIYNNDGVHVDFPGVTKIDDHKTMSYDDFIGAYKKSNHCAAIFVWEAFSQGYSNADGWSRKEFTRPYDLSLNAAKAMRKLFKIHTRK